MTFQIIYVNIPKISQKYPKNISTTHIHFTHTLLCFFYFCIVTFLILHLSE